MKRDMHAVLSERMRHAFEMLDVEDRGMLERGDILSYLREDTKDPLSPTTDSTDKTAETTRLDKRAENILTGIVGNSSTISFDCFRRLFGQLGQKESSDATQIERRTMGYLDIVFRNFRHRTIANVAENCARTKNRMLTLERTRRNLPAQTNMLFAKNAAVGTAKVAPVAVAVGEKGEGDQRRYVVEETSSYSTVISKLDFECSNPSQQQDIQPWYIILPTNKYRLAWDLFLLALILYVGITTPIRIGFNADASSLLADVEIAIDFIFLTDVVINFLTAYKRPSSSDFEYEMRLPEIAKQYLAGWFILDVFSSIPFDLFYDANEEGGGSSNIGSYSRVLKVFRLLKLMKMLRMFRVFSVVKRMQEELYLGAQGFLTALKLSIVTAAASHWFACVWGYCARDSAGNVRHDSWVAEEGLMDASVTRQYLVALYWSSMTLTTVGYGDVNPVTDSEILASVLAMILGSFFYGYIIATLSSFMSQVDCNERLMQERMDRISSYMRQRKFPIRLGREVNRYFRHYYERKTAIDEKEILNLMTGRLRRKVTHYLAKGLFKGVYLFQHLDTYSCSLLLPVISPLRYSPNEYVFYEGHRSIDEFYIMQLGCAVAYNNNATITLRGEQRNSVSRWPSAALGNDGGVGVQHLWEPTTTFSEIVNENNFLFTLREQSVFGEFSALGIARRRLYNVRCMELVEVYAISKDGLLSAFERDNAILLHIDVLVNEAKNGYIQRFGSATMLSGFKRLSTACRSRRRIAQAKLDAINKFFVTSKKKSKRMSFAPHRKANASSDEAMGGDGKGEAGDEKGVGEHSQGTTHDTRERAGLRRFDRGSRFDSLSFDNADDDKLAPKTKSFKDIVRNMVKKENAPLETTRQRRFPDASLGKIAAPPTLASVGSDSEIARVVTSDEDLGLDNLNSSSSKAVLFDAVITRKKASLESVPSGVEAAASSRDGSVPVWNRIFRRSRTQRDKECKQNPTAPTLLSVASMPQITHPRSYAPTSLLKHVNSMRKSATQRKPIPEEVHEASMSGTNRSGTTKTKGNKESDRFERLESMMRSMHRKLHEVAAGTSRSSSKSKSLT